MMTAAMNTTHPFEKAGLGTAPFRCTAVTTNWFTVPGCPEASKPGGSCDYCGTGILYEFHIVGGDGSTFKVGSDCVRKTGAEVQGFREQRLQLARTQRATKRQERYTERRARWEAEADAKLPAFDAQYPGIRDQLAAESVLEGGNAFLKDLYRKLIGWGQLSEAQVNAAKAVFERRARDDAAKPLPEFTGRVQITGTVRKLKTVVYDSYSRYGAPRTSLKMLVQHGDGWKVYGTVPDVLRPTITEGNVVTFFAKVERSRDDDKFGFFSRPSKPAIVGTLVAPALRDVVEGA